MKPLTRLYSHNTPIFLSILFFVFAGCDDFNNEINNIGPSALANKPSILKISYLEHTQWHGEFDEGTPSGHQLTYIEEPRSERKKVYVEIYDDLTYSKQIIYLDSESDFPSDKWELPADMPNLKKVVYTNGLAIGYDANDIKIAETEYDDFHWVNPSDFEKIEEAQNFVINSYFHPEANANRTLASAQKFATSYHQIDDEVAISTTHLTSGYKIQNSNSRMVENGYGDVVEEKDYIMQDLGIVYRTEGYTADGTMRDLEHHFYAFTEEGVLVMTSSHYRNRRYSKAYDLSFIEHSDIFFEDYVIQNNQN